MSSLWRAIRNLADSSLSVRVRRCSVVGASGIGPNDCDDAKVFALAECARTQSAKGV